MARDLNTASWNPVRVSGTDLPPNLLLMAKLLLLCFFVSGQWSVLPDHFLPFVPFLDHAGTPVVFQRTLQVVFAIAAISLTFNYQVRTACLVLGCVMLIAVLSSRLYSQNNRTFTGCLWLLAGLSDPGRKPWLVRYQVILLYFGAALNKLLDADWRSGQYFENLETRIGHHAALYAQISSWLPAMWLSMLVSWATIAIEFVLAGGFLIGRFAGPIAWLGIAYHTALVVRWGTFGLFYYAALSSYLAFIDWPRHPIAVVSAGPGVLKKFDLEGLLDMTRTEGSAGFRVLVCGRAYEGASALYMILAYNPLAYFAFASLLAASFPTGYFLRPGAILFLLFVTPVLLVMPLLRR